MTERKNKEQEKLNNGKQERKTNTENAGKMEEQMPARKKIQKRRERINLERNKRKEKTNSKKDQKEKERGRKKNK